jgi:hypothetical protein
MFLCFQQLLRFVLDKIDPGGGGQCSLFIRQRLVGQTLRYRFDSSRVETLNIPHSLRRQRMNLK